MNTMVPLKVLSMASFKIQDAIREVEVFFTTLYDEVDEDSPNTLIIFSFKGSRKDILKVINDLSNFFVYVFTLADISIDKFPQSLIVDDDNHVIELSKNGEWTDDDYQNLCILMEAISSLYGWTFRYNEGRPLTMGPLFKQSLQS
jgi:hypothetical protein